MISRHEGGEQLRSQTPQLKISCSLSYQQAAWRWWRRRRNIHCWRAQENNTLSARDWSFQKQQWAKGWLGLSGVLATTMVPWLRRRLSRRIQRCTYSNNNFDTKAKAAWDARAWQEQGYRIDPFGGSSFAILWATFVWV